MCINMFTSSVSTGEHTVSANIDVFLYTCLFIFSSHIMSYFALTFIITLALVFKCDHWKFQLLNTMCVQILIMSFLSLTGHLQLKGNCVLLGQRMTLFLPCRRVRAGVGWRWSGSVVRHQRSLSAV